MLSLFNFNKKKTNFFFLAKSAFKMYTRNRNNNIFPKLCVLIKIKNYIVDDSVDDFIFFFAKAC